MLREMASLVFLTLLVNGGPAFAARDNCAPITAMTTANPKALQKLSLHIGKGGWINLRYDGKSTFIGGAEDCELYGPAGGFELSCSWDIETLPEGEGRVRLLKQQLEKCLPVPFEEKLYPSSVEHLTVHQRYTANIARDDDTYLEADVTLRLYEHSRTVPSKFSLGLSISH